MSGTPRWTGLALVALLLLLAGCGKPAPQGGAAPPRDTAMAKEQKAGAESRRSSLATTRHVEMEVASDGIVALFNATQAACEADAASTCVVLQSNLSTGSQAHASLTLRAAPAGIARIVARLRVAGGLVGESAESEDLAAPIVDAERQMAMAREYRDSLLALRAKGGNDIKTLMSVNEELARVQSQLESSTGERAHLQQRIATETLTVAIAPTGENERHAWQPLSRAVHEFGANLGEAGAGAITFIAYLMPWLLVLVPLGWFVRRLWTRRRRAP